MGWKSDSHGKVLRPKEVKLYYDGGHTYKMKIGNLSKSSAIIRIATYSLPKIDYVKEIFRKRPNGIYIVCHSKFKDDALMIKKLFPEIRVAINDRVHSKLLLRAPDTIYMGSANFGVSKWHESEIGIRCKSAHDELLDKSYIPLWNSSIEIDIKS